MLFKIIISSLKHNINKKTIDTTHLFIYLHNHYSNIPFTRDEIAIKIGFQRLRHFLYFD